MKRKYILIISQLVALSALFSCQAKTDSLSSEIFCSDSSQAVASFVNDVQSYAVVDNTSWPADTKIYRIKPIQAVGDEVTVYNVKYDTRGYLMYPTDLTIKKTDYCFTYETVALYYQAFRCAPPNYIAYAKSAKITSGSDYRFVSTYTLGSYQGKNSYTESLGTFNNKKGQYLEFDIALTDSYASGGGRGAGRVVVVVDGIEDYGSDPVCYFTLDHYSHFSEFYNYASGWGEKFLGIGQRESQRNIPLTVEYTL